MTLSFERVHARVARSASAASRPSAATGAARRCTRYVAVKPALKFSNQAAGQRSIRFEGRLSRRKTLKPGVYRLTLRARDAAGNLSSRGQGAGHRAAAQALSRARSGYSAAL